VSTEDRQIPGGHIEAAHGKALLDAIDNFRLLGISAISGINFPSGRTIARREKDVMEGLISMLDGVPNSPISEDRTWR
jgi:hypothetical protein